ncbi:MAG: phospho-N-acetylmuramoyl-pentapeptide-transferase [Pleurocapsa sp.]
MDAKLLSKAKFINPSGTNLVISLACILILTAIFLNGNSVGIREHIYLVLLPLLICGVSSSLLGWKVIPLLNWLKTGQIVQEDGPQTHLKKAGTPTMGGIFFVPVAIAVAVIWCQLIMGTISSQLIAVSLVTLGYGAIGWFDDWQVLRKKSNKGISPRMKLILQVAIAILFCLWMFLSQAAEIFTLILPGNISLFLGWFFIPLAIFVFAAESNATNLTDGVDGLAAGTGAIALLGLGLIIATDAPDLMIFCVCLSGSCLGFLVHNRNPATVFMGDTGSLALGGALAAVGLLSGNLWSLFVVSGIFFVESLSVIAQVTYYKATKGADGKGKRLFKMAPIHHHFELSGWSETQVVGVFYLVNVLLVAMAYIWH